MKTPSELYARRKAAIAEAKAIGKAATDEDRHETEEEGTQHEVLIAEVDAIDAELEKFATAEGRREQLKLAEQNKPSPAMLVKPDSPAPVVSLPAEPKKPKWESFGEYLTAVKTAARAPHRIDPRLEMEIEAATGSSEGSPSGGGFAVGTEHSDRILEDIYTGGEVASRVARTKIGANKNGLTINAVAETSRASGSRWGGVSAAWTPEAGTLAASKPTMRQVEWKLKKLTALWYATDELLEDSTAMEAIAMRAFRDEINFMVEDAIIRGTGAGQPTGILNADSLVTVTKENGQVTKTLVPENIYKMWSQMTARSRPQSAWFINQDIEPQLYGMTLPIGTGGVPVFMPPGGLNTSPYATLLGRPVIPIEYASTLGTVGDIMLLDLGEYIMIDKGGIRTASSIHVQFLTEQTAFRWSLRTDGKTPWPSTKAQYKGANPLSPFVVLGTR